ncbi:hypothetical protein [Paeniglutamicibacter psychrophenolicus]|uniref:hypothetical protein n=1 Tax=Paeniglutamicibacter psychrophenolicus TaxID=257454 RepID=UPI002788ED15|nr:hypothetical protein [Paeniglutamicibacter psychrophenolicus]MDQ0093409.1 hypothetical protein [Paeniglutamicibacter psychrophenolicus]
MNEQPGTENPDGENAGAQETGTVSFGRISGGTRNGLPFLSALSFEFDDGAPDARAGKHAFESAISGLNTALHGYLQVLGTREPEFGSALGPEHEDTELLGASDAVHNALEDLGLGHRAWTGRSFPEGPLYREVPFDPGDPEDWARMLEADELARDQEGDRFGPRLDEVGATVLMGRLLHDDAHEVLHLGTATVHSNGVLLSFDYLNLRGAHEDALSWHRRSHESLGAAELGLELGDPGTGTGYPAEVHGGEGNVESGCYRLVHRFWVSRALDADLLTGTFTVNGAPTADGRTTPLAIGFELDTAVLRKSVAGIRRFGNHAPGA